MMDDFLQANTSDFGSIAMLTGFKFNQYNGSVDWENLDNLVLDDIVENADVNSLSALVASVLSYNVEKMSVSKKIFRLSQLIIDFLLHYKKHSTFKYKYKVDSIELCQLCGKMFIDIRSLKNYCFRQHEFGSCNYSPSKNEDIESLKAEIIQLQTQLKVINSTQNKFQKTKTCFEEHNHNNCDTVHENKLLYHLIAQPGDNPMQIQEMYWKQKYNCLEENYNALKNELKKQNVSKTKTDVHDKYQQCEDLNKTEKCSTYIQTSPVIESTAPMCFPKRPPRKNNVHSDENKEICKVDILNTYQANSECHRLNGDIDSDKDFYELKKLRLEARMNISDNNVCGNYAESILSSNYVEKIKIELILGKTQVNELFQNTSLMDLIKLDIKELVNKRFEECYRFVEEDPQEYDILHLKDLDKTQETCDVSLSEDYNTEPQSLLNIDHEKITSKKNKTVMSKLKKRALYLSSIFTSDSKNKNIKTENVIQQDSGLSHSNNGIINDLNE